MKKTRAKLKQFADKYLLACIFGFLIFGLFVIYSATVIQSLTLFGNPYRFVLLQFGWILLGLVGFYFFYKYDYTKLSKLAYLFMSVTLLFLILLAFAGVLPCNINIPFMPCINSANRWFYFNPSPLPPVPFLGVLGFQPSELAKFSLILYLSVQLPKVLKKGDDAFWVYLIATGMISGLIILQPNMSTAVLVFLIGTLMYFSSGVSLRPLIYLVPCLMILGIVFIVLSPYRFQRLKTYLSHSTNSTQEISPTSYHVRQVNIALGAGGWFGLGFGQSRQKYLYLPEVASDSIFAIVGEEFGWVGTTVLIFAFVFFVYRCLDLAKKVKDPSAYLLVVGITSWIGLQFFVHVAANTGLIPYTGVPIPLISYGGSSLLFSMMSMGLLLNISKNN